MKIEHSMILSVNVQVPAKKKKPKLVGWISFSHPLSLQISYSSIDCQGLCKICKLLQSFMVRAIKKKKRYEHASSSCNAKMYFVPLATICGICLSLQNTPFSAMNPSVTKIGPLYFRGLGPSMETHCVQTRKSDYFDLVLNKEKNSNQNCGEERESF